MPLVCEMLTVRMGQGICSDVISMRSLAACDWVACAAADALWLPNTERPEWLDGSMPGDRGFDPLGLAKPTEFLQVSRTPAATCTPKPYTGSAPDGSPGFALRVRAPHNAAHSGTC